mgnify:CR=1 FL=1
MYFGSQPVTFFSFEQSPFRTFNSSGLKYFSSTVTYLVQSKSNFLKTYSTKCQSVRHYINTLNNNHHYQEFRQTRTRTKDPMKLADTLDNFSTSKEYTNHVKQILIKYKGKI